MFVTRPLNHEYRDSTNTVGVLMNVTPCHCILFPMFLRVVVSPSSGSSGLRTTLRHSRGKLKGKRHPRTGYEGTRWSAPRSGLVSPGKGPVPTQEAGWAPGPLLTSYMRSIKYIFDKFNMSRGSPSTSSSRRWFSLNVLPCPQHLTLLDQQHSAGSYTKLCEQHLLTGENSFVKSYVGVFSI
jgi:hypothetical protein